MDIQATKLDTKFVYSGITDTVHKLGVDIPSLIPTSLSLNYARRAHTQSAGVNRRITAWQYTRKARCETGGKPERQTPMKMGTAIRKTDIALTMPSRKSLSHNN